MNSRFRRFRLQRSCSSLPVRAATADARSAPATAGPRHGEEPGQRRAQRVVLRRRFGFLSSAALNPFGSPEGGGSSSGMRGKGAPSPMRRSSTRAGRDAGSGWRSCRRKPQRPSARPAIPGRAGARRRWRVPPRAIHDVFQRDRRGRVRGVDRPSVGAAAIHLGGVAVERAMDEAGARVDDGADARDGGGAGGAEAEAVAGDAGGDEASGAVEPQLDIRHAASAGIRVTEAPLTSAAAGTASPSTSSSCAGATQTACAGTPSANAPGAMPPAASRVARERGGVHRAAADGCDAGRRQWFRPRAIPQWRGAVIGAIAAPATTPRGRRPGSPHRRRRRARSPRRAWA